MKGDGHVGGELLLTAKRSIGQKKKINKEQKVRINGTYAALTSEPVICVIIVEDKLPNGIIEAGIYIKVIIKQSLNYYDFIFNISGNSSYYPGGPKCIYRGKKVHILV